MGNHVNYQEIVVPAYKAEVDADKSSFTTLTATIFVIGIFIWPLLLIALLMFLVNVFSSSKLETWQVKCPKCEQETILKPPVALIYKAKDWIKPNDYDTQCTHCNSNLHFLNEHVIYKKMIPSAIENQEHP